MWDIVAISSGRRSDTAFFTEQLEKRRQLSPKWAERLGLSGATLIIPVPDPFTEDASREAQSVGSGGAALNAVLHVAEQISARSDSGSLLCQAFNGWRVAILLCGVSSCEAGGSTLGKAFAPLPTGPPSTLATGGVCNAELTLLNLQRIADPLPALWISSTEWLVQVPQGFVSPFAALKQPLSGITALALPADARLAEDHGVYKIGADHSIADVLFKPGSGAVEAGAAINGQVLVVAPVVRMCPVAAEAFLGLHTQSPFDACTYYGSDSSSSPARLNLYLDVIRACTTEGRRGYQGEERKGKGSNLSVEARNVLLRQLSGVAVRAAAPAFPPFYFAYPTTPVQWLQACLDLHQVCTHDPVLHSATTSNRIAPSTTVASSSVVFRSWLEDDVRVGDKSLILCSRLGKGVVIGKNCRVYHCYLKEGTEVPDGTHLGVLSEGSEGVATSRLSKEEIGVVQEGVAHLLCESEQEAQLKGQLEQLDTMQLCDAIDLDLVQRALGSIGDTSVSDALSRLALSRATPIESVLAALDEIVVAVHLSGTSRVLHSIADFLAFAARGKGGLRSGPARNPRWLPAITSIQTWNGNAETKALWVKALAAERSRWLATPEALIRAARHYEGAAAVITARCVDTATQFISYTKAPLPTLGQWVRAAAPARVDLAGGWSDTPPVSFETGGLVLNAAVTVNGSKPLQAYARRLNEPILRLWTDTEVVVRDMPGMLDYSTPQAPAAILKAALVALDVIDVKGAPLRSQLLDMGGGLEIRTSSTLPIGSGLGGSSILGGVLLAAVAAVIGRDYGRSSLVHAVLRLEQLLTSGGGWQDQVGGFYGGVKACQSAPALPLHVVTETVPASPAFLQRLSSHLCLVYTGRARLARNLLQGVLRRWSARLPEVVDTVTQLRANATDLLQAFKNEDIPAIGGCVLKYWMQKQNMAGTGVEPAVVRKVCLPPI